MKSPCREGGPVARRPGPPAAVAARHGVARAAAWGARACRYQVAGCDADGAAEVRGYRDHHAREPTDLRAIPMGSVVHFEREIVGAGMWSAVRDRLTEAGPATTRWEQESEYRFSSLLMRLVGLLMPSAFRKQSLQHMQDFKAFAEQGKDVRETEE
ncbi:MAG: SRPBCC family protein [Caldilineaceae bacterium]